jgi:hypothetical protein
MIECELFTANHILHGFVDTRDDRLSDLLNNQKESSLMMTETRIVRLLNIGGPPPAKVLDACIDKSSILFARPISQDMTQKSIFRRATRQIYPIAINLPRFEIQGMIHQTDRLDIERILIDRPENFIPLTNATAIFLLNPKLTIRSSMLIINKNHIHLIAEILPNKDNPPLTEEPQSSDQ